MIQNGNPEAYTELIERNAGFIRQLAGEIAKLYPCAVIGFDDYEQEGRIALLHAARLYDPEKSRFLTFASTVIRSSMLDALRRVHPEIQSVEWEKLPQPVEAAQNQYTVPGLDPYRKNPEQIYLKKEQMDELHAAMEKTSIRENAWVRHRFGFDDEPCTLAAAARHYGLSTSRARHIEKQALSHIRKNLLGESREKGAA
ncbi:MAG: sigma-70 family RNA polymerase sigma factor [bacterium]|nr:sigma-70 family RNA polymerase sigma factor [bacterium]